MSTEAKSYKRKNVNQNKLYYYRVYNLTLQSPFSISELISIKPQKTDIIFAEKQISENLNDFKKSGNILNGLLKFQTDGKSVLFVVENTAKYLIKDQNTIYFEKSPDIPDSTIALYLLGACFSCINVMRGKFGFHASAILSKNGCKLFMGDSGMGKSTTAAKMIERGYNLIADDLSIIDFDEDDMPRVYPAYPQMKLWDTSLEKIGLKKSTYKLVIPGLEKFRIPVKANFSSNPSRLSAIYLLSATENLNKVSINHLETLQKVFYLLDNIFGKLFIELFSLEKKYLDFCVKIASKVQVKLIERPVELFLLDELADEIENDFKTY